MHKVRTARGDVIDFSELVIKQQLSATPPSIDVQARDHFVEQRLKRRSRKKAVEMAQTMSDTLTEDDVSNIDTVDEHEEPIVVPPAKVRMKRE